MKKIFTHLTGIVFLTAILLTGACSPAVPPPARGPKTVTIYMKAIKIKGEKHLEMYDSNKPGVVVVDTLETLVMPGDTVVWEITSQWRMKKLTKIGRQTKGVIIEKDAEPIPGTRSFSLIIPKDAPVPSEREKYDINFKGWFGKTWPIDPYLKIPRQSGGG